MEVPAPTMWWPATVAPPTAAAPAATAAMPAAFAAVPAFSAKPMLTSPNLNPDTRFGHEHGITVHRQLRQSAYAFSLGNTHSCCATARSLHRKDDWC